MAILHGHNLDSSRELYSVRPKSNCTYARLVTPRVFRPVNPSENALPAPQQTCTPLSYYLTFFYVDYIVRKGVFRELSIDDLPPLPDNFRAKLWRKKYLESKHMRTLWKLISMTKVQILWYIT